jgi:dehydrogenase/reductase SDR family member 12
VDLTGRSFLVTGANSGLGRAAALALAARGGSVHMLCRSRERGESAAAAVRAVAPDPAAVTLHVCDLASLADVRRFAGEFRDATRQLDVLVNNAGLMVHERRETAEGIEMNFGVNVLGTYVLTELLMPCLEAARDARVVCVSSAGMLLAGKEALREGTCVGDDLMKPPVGGDRGYETETPPLPRIDGQAAYSRNKRCQVALTEHWADAHAKSGVRFFVMHPGWASTDGLQNAMPEFHSAFEASLRSAEEGADTIVWLAVADEALKEEDGTFFLDRQSQPKHLWVGGTRYSKEDVAGLVARLNDLARDKAGINIPPQAAGNR